jgi:hypothetical protein
MLTVFNTKETTYLFGNLFLFFILGNSKCTASTVKNYYIAQLEPLLDLVEILEVSLLVN